MSLAKSLEGGKQGGLNVERDNKNDKNLWGESEITEILERDNKVDKIDRWTIVRFQKCLGG